MPLTSRVLNLATFRPARVVQRLLHYSWRMTRNPRAVPDRKRTFQGSRVRTETSMPRVPALDSGHQSLVLLLPSTPCHAMRESFHTQRRSGEHQSSSISTDWISGDERRLVFLGPRASQESVRRGTQSSVFLLAFLCDRRSGCGTSETLILRVSVTAVVTRAPSAPVSWRPDTS